MIRSIILLVEEYSSFLIFVNITEITDEACDEDFIEKDLIDNDAKGL